MKLSLKKTITGEKINPNGGTNLYTINNGGGDLLFPSDVITSDDKIEYCLNIVTDNSNNYVGFSYLVSIFQEMNVNCLKMII